MNHHLIHRIGIGTVTILLCACAATPVAAPAPSPQPSDTPTALPLTSSPSPTTALATLTPVVSPSATMVIYPSMTPAPTPTPVSIPAFVTHTWQTQPVLIEYGYSSGDGGLPFWGTASIVLYANGTFITWQRQGDRFEQMQTTLSRKQTCALLNTIEQTGLFNLAAENWDDRSFQAGEAGYAVGEGSPALILHVRGWLTQTVIFANWIGFMGTFNDAPREITSRYVPESIQDTTALLSSYEPATLKPYIPQHIMLMVGASDDAPSQDTAQWPLALRLDSLVTPTPKNDDPYQYIPDVNYMVTGPAAIRFYEKYYRQSEYPYDWLSFREDGKLYHVAARALLPLESMQGRVNYETLPSSDVRTSSPVMTCYPSDGVLPIPTRASE